jgi:hypothetical protein
MQICEPLSHKNIEELTLYFSNLELFTTNNNTMIHTDYSLSFKIMYNQG